MAKAKRASKSEDPAEAAARFRRGLRSELQGFGTKKLGVGERAFLSAGINAPLAFQYLIDCTALPLGLVYQLTGDRGSLKTTFAFELMRWCLDVNGFANFALTEGKFSPPLCKAVVGYPDEGANDFQYYESSSMQDWQTYMSAVVEYYNKILDVGGTFEGVKHPPGLYGPVCLVVDSLVAQYTTKQAESIKDAGGSERSYPVHVKALSEWLSQVIASVSGRPYVMALINHCQIDRPDPYRVEVTEKGGRKLSYGSSLIVFMSANKPDTSTYNAEGWVIEQTKTRVTFSLNKSSVGSDNRSLRVNVVNRYQIMEDGSTRQRTWFLWGQALVDLLMAAMYQGSKEQYLVRGLDTDTARKWYRDNIFSVVKFEAVSGRKNMYTCSKYATEPGQVFSGEELGAAMSADPEFVAVFQRVFALKHYDVWPENVNFNDFLADIRKRLNDDSVKIPTKVE